MPIKYACVNTGKTLVAEFPVMEQPRLATTLQTIFATVPLTEFRRQTVEDTDDNFHFVAAGDGRIIGCASTKDVKGRIIFSFLDGVEAVLRGPTADMRNAKKVLQRNMEFHNDPANDKPTAILLQLDHLRDLMTENMRKALEKGERIAALDAKAVTMVQQSTQFRDEASKLKRMFCLRNAKFGFLVLGGVIVLLLIILLAVCKPNFSAC
jgi:hypothetical protein